MASRYLEEKNVKNLLKEAMASLLEQKPNDPCSFLASYFGCEEKKEVTKAWSLSEQQTAELVAFFQCLDTDGDGVLSQEESATVPGFMVPFRDALMDGKITFREFVNTQYGDPPGGWDAAFNAPIVTKNQEFVAKEWSLSEQDTVNLAAFFGRLDIDGDGYLSAEEAETVPGFMVPFKEALLDGKINFREFIRTQFGDPPGGWDDFGSEQNPIIL